jgi:hypothetical protein
MSTKSPLKLEWTNPTTNEECELPLNDLSIAMAYMVRYQER